MHWLISISTSTLLLKIDYYLNSGELITQYTIYNSSWTNSRVYTRNLHEIQKKLLTVIINQY